VESRINYLLLATALLGTFFSGTATRIVSISMPTVAQSLGTDLLGVSWALLSYQLSNIGLSVVFGRISDMWGREKVFALGFFVFALSSLLCGFSQTVLQLILARFVPIVRTFMPFVAGAACMRPARFVLYNLVGAVGWVALCMGAGFLFGVLAVLLEWQAPATAATGIFAVDPVPDPAQVGSAAAARPTSVAAPFRICRSPPGSSPRSAAGAPRPPPGSTPHPPGSAPQGPPRPAARAPSWAGEIGQGGGKKRLVCFPRRGRPSLRRPT
jgi:MFS family permease